MLIHLDEPGIPSFEPDFRLLYVGSDQDFLMALRKTLRKPVYLVVACPDRGSAHLFLTSDIPYNLFLFELEERNTTSLELLQLARSLSHREHLPIITVAANEGTNDLQKAARRAGANECLSATRDISFVMPKTIERWLGIGRKKRARFNSPA